MNNPLQYKTRGDSSPQGKPRVYFCCHPDDFAQYFEGIADEILSRQNCAVYYSTEDSAFDEERRFDLSRMQLFVMPVTTNLLTKKSFALDEAFPFAMERHIPVLPLMQESGLESVFNLKCGDLQFLDKTQRDPSAIPYEEKLTRYLSSILVGDELAEKVRAAFDAYIFMSYRKKDRVYAQKLMRMIHRNRFTRDIAIWYDEFLKPGENFNQAILDAMQNSKLFTLLVTPNLINEENYVITKEYPAAKKSGKPILPAMSEETDRQKLEELFDDIPPCVDANDAESLDKSLENALQGIALLNNDNDPEHNFFIGLAYLKGIDVEVDAKRGVEMIEESANAGLPEAMEMLVAMFRSGDGVAIDYNKAIEWQEKLVEYLRKKYGQYQEDSYNQLFSELWHLGDYYYEVRNLDKAKSIYLEMQKLCGEQESTISVRRDLSVSLGKLGDICKSEGDITSARKCYEESYGIRKVLADETHTVESRRDLSISLNNIGDICKSEGDITSARKYYEESLEIRKAIADETNMPLDYNNLAVSYYFYAKISEKQRQIELLQKAYKIWCDLAERCHKVKEYAQRRDIVKEELQNLS